MKYLIDHLCINENQIAMAEYTPAHESQESTIRITLTSTEASYDKDGWPVASTSDLVELCGMAADLFWNAYIGDAYAVISPKQTQKA